MPSGVFSPRVAASMVEAKPKRPVMKGTWDARARKASMRRKALLTAVRAGDKQAIDLLWREYRCRIWTEPTSSDQFVTVRPSAQP